ncbi:hypothetical protein JW906_01475 [bacterium]|nr:hypothetical protein [bacterium]
MAPKNQKLGGILFVIAAVAWFFAGSLDRRPTFFVLGCAFLVIGLGMLSQSKKKAAK